MKNTNRIINAQRINDFKTWLHGEERSSGTVEKYVRDIKALYVWLNGREITKENIADWKASLLDAKYKPVTINSMLTSVNTFCRYADIDCKIKFLKVQRSVFREEEKELTQAEYERLIMTAQAKGNERLALLLETIGSTGIRVSEVQYITVAGVFAGKVQIALKGKIRVIMLPKKLCRKLLKYAHKQRIASGEIFITKNGKGLSRKQIWAEMKKLCKEANVPESKVFPHNLRHLFARVFYRITRDIAKLSDLLGHSSIDRLR